MSYANPPSKTALRGFEKSIEFYTDQELDASTGLYNYDARLYDPVVGLFMSADTVVPYPYDPQSFNRYSYCRNNPLRFIDPSGHSYGSWGPGGSVDFGDSDPNFSAGEWDQQGKENNGWGDYYAHNGSSQAGVIAVPAVAGGEVLRNAGNVVVVIGKKVNPYLSAAMLAAQLDAAREKYAEELEKKAKDALDADKANAEGVNGESDDASSDIPMTPPDGLKENPHREGSWGEYDERGKFREKWRLDKGRPEIKRGHGSVDHIHINGEDQWHPKK